ncbi:hemerythrin family protein [Azospirillum sp. sgz301742]
MTKAELGWDDSYSLGLPEIDAEHRKLDAVYNTIRASLEGGDGVVDLQTLCGELLAFTREHFAREEEMMAAHAYPDLEAHRKLHRTFLQQIEDIWTFVRTGGEPDDYLGRFLVLSFIGRWLKMHTMVVDRRFGEWLALHVRKELPEGVE